MSGIVCLWQTDDEPLARTMLARIAHRGPDGEDVARGRTAPAIMAYRRQSIDGAQGIVDRGGDLLVLDGEFHHRGGSRLAQGEGVPAPASDADAVLRLFHSGEPDWVARLDGAFAFVLATRERVIAVRDALGIKPLYRSRIGDGMAFASELKAFDGVAVDAVEAIPPGSLFDSREGLRRWYRLPQGIAEPEPGSDTGRLARELRTMIEGIVDRSLAAEVEVGSFLSGGLDSSIVAAMAARRSPSRLQTFSVGAPGSADLRAARRLADHLGTDHHERTFTADEVAAALPQVVYQLESADVDLVRSAVPTQLATMLAREHVAAVLTGEGADELFAGYAYHHAYVDRPRELADELTRSLDAMHNVGLQRVDRITTGQGLAVRMPFLDRELVEFAQSLPASLKLRRTDPQAVESTGTTTEKWILRKACADLLPADIAWRKKAQFDAGSGTVSVLQAALQTLSGDDRPLDREAEGNLYESLLRSRYEAPDVVLSQAGSWAAGRVASS